MGTMTNPMDEPLQVPDLPEEEGIETADVAEQIDEDPAEQRNATDPERAE